MKKDLFKLYSKQSQLVNRSSTGKAIYGAILLLSFLIDGGLGKHKGKRVH
jgi:hypothetical protein